MMTGCYHHLSADRDRDVLILTLAAKEICQPELAESIRREMASACQAEGLSRVIVDMSNVEFISSVGYAPLISLRRDIIGAGGKLVLCRLSSFVREVFVTTRMLIDLQNKGSMFYFADSLEEARTLVAQSD